MLPGFVDCRTVADIPNWICGRSRCAHNDVDRASARIDRAGREVGADLVDRQAGRVENCRRQVYRTGARRNVVVMMPFWRFWPCNTNPEGSTVMLPLADV